MSSSTEDPPLRSLAAEALAVLRRELPSAYLELGARLAGRSLRAAVDGEVIGIEFTPRRIGVGRPSRAADLYLEADGRELLDLLEGRRAFRDGLEAGRIDVKAGVDDLLRFREAATLFVAAAARCPSFAALLTRFRRCVGGPAASGRDRLTTG